MQLVKVSASRYAVLDLVFTASLFVIQHETYGDQMGKFACCVLGRVVFWDKVFKVCLKTANYKFLPEVPCQIKLKREPINATDNLRQNTLNVVGTIPL